MKGFMKVVVWVLVLIGVAVGVYFLLPEYPQSFVKSVFQPMVDAQAKTRIEQVQGLLNKDLNNVSYKTIFEAQTKNPCWVYSCEEGSTTEYVIFYGRGVSINLKDWEEYNGMFASSASVKIVFEIVGDKVEIHPYVDGTLMEINDGKHTEENKAIRLDLFTQLYGGMTIERQK